MVAVDEPKTAFEAYDILRSVYEGREDDDYEPIMVRGRFFELWDELTTDWLSDIMIQLKDGHRVTIIKKEA